jgi:cyclophilin family peptidyl-prolyl cis-trans isomerase
MLPKLSANTVAPQITMETSLGTVVFELNFDLAPITVENILNYVNIDFYNDTLFHRVISGFMVQGGGFTTGMVKSDPISDSIVLESDNGLSNIRGTIAMARTSVPDSATSQFFINLVDNGFLDYQSAPNPGYAVFGEVISGLSVIDDIAKVATTTVGWYQDVPLIDIIITSFQQTLSNQTVRIDDVSYLNNISLNYIKDSVGLVEITEINNGLIVINQNINFDEVKVSNSATYTQNINISDAIIVLRHIVDLEPITQGSDSYHAADVNNDGNISISDAISILRHIVGLEVLDTFDLVDENGNRITSLNPNSPDNFQDWVMVANGDVNMSGEFDTTYVMADIM